MNVNIGCQTITFGDAMHKDNIKAVFDSVAAAGYAGVEFGFFRIKDYPVNYLRELLDADSLMLAAVHVGGNILDAASQREQMDNIDLVISTVGKLGGKMVFVSGNSKDDFKEQAAKYNLLGERVHDAGLLLCYHNHDWEIKDGFNGLNRILDATKPEYLSLVMDVGWVKRGGADPIKAVNEYSSRLKHIHLKEFTSDGEFTELGKGIVDFKGVYETLKGRSEDMWFIAEQDKSDIGAEKSVIENCAYMKKMLEG